jgi:uncharacterized membrane protein YphA (DoxX/SURF4 family)
MANAGTMVGRLLLAAIFILGGLKLAPADYEKTVSFTTQAFKTSGITEAAAKSGFDIAPLIPAALVAATVLEVVGGLLLLIGFESTGALLLLIFLAVVTPIMHNPISNGVLVQLELIAFLKNAALAGAMLYIISNDKRTRKAKAA